MSAQASKKRIFLAALPPEKREAWETYPKLAALLDDAWATARVAHPRFLLTCEAFVCALALRCAAGSVLPEEVFAADLYLALACSAGEREALDLFEKLVLSKIHGSMLRNASRHAADETMQRLRIALFVATERRPGKMVTYSGKVPLAGWLSIVAQRELVDYLREAAQPTKKVSSRSLRADLDKVPTAATADVDYFQKVNDAAIRNALAGTFKRLSMEERKLLTWLVKEGVTIDILSERLAVHRSTAARMVAKVKARMLEGVRDGLRTDLGVSESSLDSICASMAERLDVTLNGIIGRSED